MTPNPTAICVACDNELIEGQCPIHGDLTDRAARLFIDEDGREMLVGRVGDSPTVSERCDRIVNNGMGEPTECGRTLPCDRHSPTVSEPRTRSTPDTCSHCGAPGFRVVDNRGDGSVRFERAEAAQPIDAVIANALEVPEAPWEMDTVQGRDAWEAGYEAALNAVSAARAEAAQPIDVERWAKWVVEVSGVDRLDSLIYDHACAECVPDGPMVVAGFVCVPHAAARLRASDTDQ